MPRNSPAVTANHTPTHTRKHTHRKCCNEANYKFYLRLVLSYVYYYLMFDKQLFSILADNVRAIGRVIQYSILYFI